MEAASARAITSYGPVTPSATTTPAMPLSCCATWAALPTSVCTSTYAWTVTAHRTLAWWRCPQRSSSSRTWRGRPRRTCSISPIPSVGCRSSSAPCSAAATVVTISLAGSLFFSISPDAADHKILLYLLFTLAPFAIVSPLLGPLIDRSRGARRLMVVLSAVGQVVLCPLMATHLHSLLLFPLAFLVLVCQKLYLVTKGALVPEMAALDGTDSEAEQAGYATLNARLTLLGTLAGFVASVPAVILYKVAGSPGVLVFATIVFVGATVAGARLPVLSGRRAERLWADEADQGARVRPGG